MRLLISILINAVAIFFAGWLLSGVTVDDFGTAILAALVLGVINWTIRPLLTILTLPITVLTFGLFLLVINGAMVLLADYFLDGFEVANLLWALIFLLVVSIFNGIFGMSQRAPESR